MTLRKFTTKKGILILLTIFSISIFNFSHAQTKEEINDVLNYLNNPSAIKTQVEPAQETFAPTQKSSATSISGGTDINGEYTIYVGSQQSQNQNTQSTISGGLYNYQNSSIFWKDYVSSSQQLVQTVQEQTEAVKVNTQNAAQKKAEDEARKKEAVNKPKTYQPLAGINGITKDSEQTGLKEILNFIFTWGIRVAVLLALIMIIFGGVEYMTSDAVFNKEDGIHKINAAIIGLILTLSAWLILYTINPRIVEEPNSALFGPKTK